MKESLEIRFQPALERVDPSHHHRWIGRLACLRSIGGTGTYFIGFLGFVPQVVLEQGGLYA